MPIERDLDALTALLAERLTKPFRWSGRGCCIGLGSRAVEAQIGIDPRFGLSWSTKAEALAVLAAEGGIEAAMDARFDRIAPALAPRGDLAAVPCDELGCRIMVIEGATLAAPGARRLERLPRSAMTIAWNILTVREPDHG